MSETTETMVDRVTAAIVRALRASGEVMHVGDHDKLRGFHELNGDFDIRSVARAAIEAMREPTEAMAVDGGLELEEQIFAQQGLVFDGAKAVFQCMIDTALAEATAPR